MASTRDELLDALETYVKSNASPSLTRAADVRAMLELIVAAVVNIMDDKDQPDGYMGITDGQADVAFLAEPIPTGLFLQDTGTWADILDRFLYNFDYVFGDITDADRLIDAIGKLAGKLQRSVEATSAGGGSIGPFESKLANAAVTVVYVLPVTPTVGDKYWVNGKGLGGWRITQNANQTILSSSASTTTGVGGKLESANRYDCVELECISPTDFLIVNKNGNLVFT